MNTWFFGGVQMEHHHLDHQSLSIHMNERSFTMSVINTIELPKRRAAIENLISVISFFLYKKVSIL